MWWNGFMLAAAMLGLGLSGGTASANLVANPGFEDGPNHVNPPKSWNGNEALVESGLDEGSHTGNRAAFFGFFGFLGFISQDLTTTPGQTYAFSFWYASDGGLPNEFVAQWNGATIFDVVNDPAHGYKMHSFNVLATGSTTTITFGGRNDPDFQALDDVSVTAVPEPSTLAGCAFIAVALVGWTHRKRAS